MSSKEAVKKRIDSKSHVKSQSSHKVKVNVLNHGVNESEDKTEKKERKKEPQIKDTKVSRDRKTKLESSSTSKNVLPDKNPIKLKQLKENSLSVSKSKFEEMSRTSNILQKPILSKTKSESSTKIHSIDKSKTNTQKNYKEKSHYNEKRGLSSIYIPKDLASKLNSTSKSSDTRRSREKLTTTSKSSEKAATTIRSSDKHSISKKSEKSSISKSSDKQLLRASSRERKKSRTLSPSEVKVLKSSNTKGKSKIIKSVQDQTIAKKKNVNATEFNIEDFEDYESELEECHSASQISEESDISALSLDLEPIVLQTEEKKRTVHSAYVRKVDEEHMLDSGHYELQEAKKRAAMVESLMANRMKTPPPLPEFSPSVSQPEKEEKLSENKSLPLSTDEGFEDSRSGDFVKSPPMSHVIVVNSDKPKLEKVLEKPKNILTRGQILMNMIKLDTVEWSLYESKPISYEEFIRTFGKLNTQQISTQTNEDNLDIEVQTDKYELENKWTQFPVKCRTKLKTNEDVRLFKMEHNGVGGEQIEIFSIVKPVYDVLRLNEFLSKAGKVVLALLEEKQYGGNILQNDTHEFPFSEGFIKLSVSSLSFLCGRQVTMLHYSEINNKILMSIHSPTYEKTDSSSKQDYIKDCCIGCVWNVNQPSRPIKLFYSQSPITSCCFHCTNNNIVFAGLQDGSVCLWDLREEESWHQKIIDKVNEICWIVRSPTYTTAGNWDIGSHLSPVISIRILSKLGQDGTESFNDKFIPIQICTLDEEGNLIIWSALRNLGLNDNDLGLTQWGRVKLVKSQEVPLYIKKNESNKVKREFIDMNVDTVDCNNLYLATNDTNILYVNCIGGRSSIPYYKINEMDSCGSTTCLEVCPFKQSYFYAGCKDGSIRLHSLNIETPLLKLKDEDNSAGIKSIQWSRSKPLTLYALDENSRIVVWNLSNSDIYPTHVVSTKNWGYVKCMRLSPCNTNRDMINQYLALGTDTGNVEVHKLKKNFFFAKHDDYLQEMNTFLRYVSIL